MQVTHEKNYYNLLDGSKIPVIGFGNYNAHGADEITAIQCALEAGYRYIDSAARYENEADLGQALQAALNNSSLNIKRGDLYLLSKVWPSAYDNVERSLLKTLDELQVDILDAYLLHWPTTSEARRLSAYEQAMRLREKGLFKTLGVSNFSIEQIEKVYQEFGEYPAINQIESHPIFQQRDLVNACQARGIQVIDYRPINRNAYAGNETLEAIAAKHGKTVTQIVLRWHVEHGQIPIPKSATPSRIRENINIFDFALTPNELATIDALEAGKRCNRQDPATYNGEY